MEHAPIIPYAETHETLAALRDVEHDPRLAEADAHLAAERWQAAIDLLDDDGPAIEAARHRRILARNMLALQRHRPEIYECLHAATGADRYEIERLRDGRWSIAQRETGGGRVSLAVQPPSPGADPLAPYVQALSAPVAKALHGVGDGAILDWIGWNPQHVFHDAEPAVYVIEPDVALLRCVLMLHEFTHPEGALAGERFEWFVGSDAREQVIRTMLQTPGLSIPPCCLTLNGDAARSRAIWDEVRARRSREMITFNEKNRALARSMQPDQLAALFGSDPPRPPRVLLCTSRFTTVLQYATEHAADAFAQAGWNTRILREARRHHLVTPQGFAQAVAEYQPDLIFTIDHLRYEYPFLPREIPYICWIQDNLGNLTSKEAGKSIGERDFIIGAWVDRYVREWDYPARQCFTIPRLTPRRRPRPQHIGDGPDMVYVSHASADPQQRLRELVDEFKDAPPAARLIEQTGNAIIAHYRADECLRSRREVRAIIDRIAHHGEHNLLHETHLHQITTLLFDRLNLLLYRQQTLAWAVEIAQQRGLSLAIYGKGWEKRDRFAPHARGVIEYGEALEDLTRRARINLQLEPYIPASHQRMIDGLAAGGFFLSRLFDPHLPARMRWWALMDGLDESVKTLDEARARIDPSSREELEQLHQTLAPVAGCDDLVRRYRERQTTVVARDRKYLPPRYLEIAFSGPAEFADQVVRFLHDDALRHEIAAEQQRFVEAHFTYTSELPRVLRQIAERLEDAAEAAREPAGAVP